MQNDDVEENLLHDNNEDNRDIGEREATDASTDIKSFKRIHLFHGSVGSSNAETKHSEQNISTLGSENTREAIREFWLDLAENDRRALMAPDASSSTSPVSGIYDGDAYFDLETGFWVPTQPTSSVPATPSAALPCPDPGCSRSFRTASDLQKHRRAHSKRFHCRICDEAYMNQRGLDRHMVSRHGVWTAKSETQKCRVCDRVGRRDNIRRHEKTQHGLQ
jgi:hypothetical protein